eukprot:339090_1
MGMSIIFICLLLVINAESCRETRYYPNHYGKCVLNINTCKTCHWAVNCRWNANAQTSDLQMSNTESFTWKHETDAITDSVYLLMKNYTSTCNCQSMISNIDGFVIKTKSCWNYQSFDDVKYDRKQYKSR